MYIRMYLLGLFLTEVNTVKRRWMQNWILDTFLTNVLGNFELFRAILASKFAKIWHMKFVYYRPVECGHYTFFKRVYIDFPVNKTFFIRLNPDSIADIIKRLMAEYCFRSENLRTLPRISIFWFKFCRLFPELASASRDNSFG